MTYFRPIPMTDPARPEGGFCLAGGWCWFDRVEVLERGRAPQVISARDMPREARARLSDPRPEFAGLAMDRPRLMGILNVTPDSFSDGGLFIAAGDALAQARAMAEGADILDIGGESTRPGAAPVPVAEEIARTAPVIAALRAEGFALPISIDTRNAAVAAAAIDAGADLFNDVSALRHDPGSLALAADRGVPVCLMHALGDPKTMQDAPTYDDVLLDVLDMLEARVAAAEAAGIPKARVLVDPGIGFGKTVAHNLALVRGLAAFHGLGCAILFGASRKRFVGTIGDAPVARDRVPGSIAVALEALRQGAQVLRVHDVTETRQAVALWRALNGDEE